MRLATLCAHSRSPSFRPIVAAGLPETVMARVSLLVLLVTWSVACSGGHPSVPSSNAQGARTTSLAAGGSSVRALPESTVATGAPARAASVLRDSGDAQWTIPAKNYASTRYSGLRQITTE